MLTQEVNKLVDQWLSVWGVQDFDNVTRVTALFSAFNAWKIRKGIYEPVLRRAFTNALDDLDLPKVTKYENWPDVRPVRIRSEPRQPKT